MTLQELIDAVILKATGKVTILAPGNAKWEKIRGIANFYQHAWMHEPKVRWKSRYERARQIGTISTSDEYELDDDILEISTAWGDNVYVDCKDGKRDEYQLVEYDDLRNYSYGNYCAKIGNKLVFNRKFTENDLCYGGALYAPVYADVEDLENASDDIMVDNPYWLVLICAAEYIRNDVVKQNQYGNPLAEANDLMEQMIWDNEAKQKKPVRGDWRNGGGLSYD